MRGWVHSCSLRRAHHSTLSPRALLVLISCQFVTHAFSVPISWCDLCSGDFNFIRDPSQVILPSYLPHCHATLSPASSFAWGIPSGPDQISHYDPSHLYVPSRSLPLLLRHPRHRAQVAPQHKRNPGKSSRREKKGYAIKRGLRKVSPTYCQIRGSLTIHACASQLA